MTQLLQQAIDAVQMLTPADQDAIAAIILDELADEQQWDAAFARSEDQLASMVAKVRADIAAGRVQSQGIDEL
jgi:hypothetical protein